MGISRTKANEDDSLNYKIYHENIILTIKSNIVGKNALPNILQISSGTIFYLSDMGNEESNFF